MSDPSPRVGFWQKLTTGLDNYTPDIGRWSWLLCTASVLCLAAWHEAHAIRESLKDLAFALSGIAVTHGAALGLKARTEPSGDSSHTTSMTETHTSTTSPEGDAHG